LGIVFQDFKLLPDRNVYQNLAFVLRATGWKNKSERDARIAEVLTLVNLEGKEKKVSTNAVRR
jgi:cell division transport system ATP-binding protein